MTANALCLHANATGLKEGRGNLGKAANFGLAYEKFFGFWDFGTAEKPKFPPEIAKTPVDPVLIWLSGIEAPRKGDRVSCQIGELTLIKANAVRLETMVAALGGKQDVFELQSRLITGTGSPHPTENGFVFHPVLGVPYLSAAGLKQVAAEAMTLLADEIAAMPDIAVLGLGAAEIEAARQRVTGDADDGAGSVIFLDGLPVECMSLEAEIITGHYGPYYAEFNPEEGRGQKWDDFYEPADWHDPNPVTLLSVGKGARFRLGVLPRRRAAADDVVLAQAALTTGLDILGFGAKTALGYGRLAPAGHRG